MSKNIGFVSYWFNRGQAVVTRYIKSIFDEAGYNTFVLVRSAKEESLRGDWHDKNVTIGSKEYNMHVSTYTNWARENKIDVCFFDQNYQFDEIKALRDMGVKTIGRFVWEQFGKNHVKKARKSFDIIYSLTRCEHDRYINELNINPEFIRWGVHPSLLKYSINRRKDGLIWFYYPAGFCSGRKSVYETIKAFSMVKDDNIRLLVSSQKPVETMGSSRKGKVGSNISYDEFLNDIGDSRIKLDVGNVLSHKEFHKAMYSCDVCIIPSRWEGLGLAFMEAIAFQMPILTPDYPPMNEYIINEKTGFLVNCRLKNQRTNGIWIADISVKNLAKKISEISNRDSIHIMSKNTKSILQEKFSWDNTREDYIKLLNRL